MASFVCALIQPQTITNLITSYHNTCIHDIVYPGPPNCMLCAPSPTVELRRLWAIHVHQIHNPTNI